MSRIIALTFFFILSIIAQISFVHSLAYPFSLLPLHFLFGIIVMHRSDVQNGVIWFIATPIFLFLFANFTFGAFWANIFVAGFGYLLSKRIFTTRSVYALEGLGLTLFTIYVAINSIVALFGKNAAGISTMEFFYSLSFLLIGLYIGFVVAKYIEHLAVRVFLIRT